MYKDIVWDAKFKDCSYVNSLGKYVLDYSKLDTILHLDKKTYEAGRSQYGAEEV